MQPYELRRRQRLRNKPDFSVVQVGSGKSAQNVNEKDILERVVRKFKAHLEAKKNPIMEAVKFDRRRQSQGETFDSFVTDLKLLESDDLKSDDLESDDLENDDLENGDLENNDLENDARFYCVLQKHKISEVQKPTDNM